MKSKTLNINQIQQYVETNKRTELNDMIYTVARKMAVKIINQEKKMASKSNKPAWETRLERKSTKVAKWHKIIERRIKQEDKTNEALRQIPNKPETNICLSGDNK